MQCTARVTVTIFFRSLRRGDEVVQVGSHDDLRPDRGYLSPDLPARAGGRLAGKVAQRGLGAGAVRHSSQTLLDGGPKLTLGGPLPGDGLARLGGSLSHIPGRWDGLDLGRRAGLPRRIPDLWLQTPRPAARIFGFHELWHHFVLASSACRFRVMLRYIAPLS